MLVNPECKPLVSLVGLLVSMEKMVPEGLLVASEKAFEVSLDRSNLDKPGMVAQSKKKSYCLRASPRIYLFIWGFTLL